MRWRLVIHSGIGGFSRLVVFLKCSANNKVKTVLDSFYQAIQRYRTPLKIRTDHGTENIEVARYILEKHGVEGNPVITDKSVHDQRIERLWVDLNTYVIQHFRNIFYNLELEHGVNSSCDIDLYALHYVFVLRINNMLQEFSSTWNNHSVRTKRHRTPLQIWTEGFYRLTPTNINGLLEVTDSSFYGIDDNGPTPELQTANNVQVPEIDIQLSVDQENYLASTFNPCADDGNFGINTFLQVRNSLTQLLEHS